MSQTSYLNTFPGGFSGQVLDTGPSRKGAWINGEGDDIPAGVFVAFSAESNQYKTAVLPAAADARIVGIAINSFARDPGFAGSALSGDAAIRDGAVMNVMEEGAMLMACEQTMGPADPVYCRITSDGGSNTQLGKIRKDSDSGRAIVVPGAHVKFGGTTSQPAGVYFSAAVNLQPGNEQTAIADLTDNSGGATADGTIGAVTAPSALTDNSGGAAADGTIGVITVPTALTGAGSGTANGALEAEGTLSTGGGNTYSDSAVNTILAKIENNIMELATSQTANITAITAARDAVKELSTAQAQDRTAVIALTDAIKELSTKVNAILAADRAAGILQA